MGFPSLSGMTTGSGTSSLPPPKKRPPQASGVVPVPVVRVPHWPVPTPAVKVKVVGGGSPQVPEHAPASGTHWQRPLQIWPPLHWACEHGGSHCSPFEGVSTPSPHSGGAHLQSGWQKPGAKHAESSVPSHCSFAWSTALSPQLGFLKAGRQSSVGFTASRTKAPKLLVLVETVSGVKAGSVDWRFAL